MRFTFDNFVSKSIRKSLRMFNLYQHMKPGDAKEQKEAETTGHDRFYQERSRSSYRKKKKRACRRAQSAAEFDPASVAAANKRDAFRLRSVSTDKEESEGKSVWIEPKKTSSLLRTAFSYDRTFF